MGAQVSLSMYLCSGSSRCDLFPSFFQTTNFPPPPHLPLQGDKEIVELLLQHNADPSLATPAGMTAYSVATEGGRKVVALLIAEACVLRGVYNEDKELILESIKRGAFVNIPTPGGWTALVYAVRLSTR